MFEMIPSSKSSWMSTVASHALLKLGLLCPPFIDALANLVTAANISHECQLITNISPAQIYTCVTVAVFYCVLFKSAVRLSCPYAPSDVQCLYHVPVSSAPLPVSYPSVQCLCPGHMPVSCVPCPGQLLLTVPDQ